MDRRKWLPPIPLFDAPACVYCGGPANTSDHTPPRCFLPRDLPSGVQLMTIPACDACNRSFQRDELRAAAIICAVSFYEWDKAAVSKGGWVYSAGIQDVTLRRFIDERIGTDGLFRMDNAVLTVFQRVLTKTAVGLLFYEFGRVIRRDRLKLIGLEHAHNVQPNAYVELHRREDTGWAEVTPSGRELERQVMAVCGITPRFMPAWKLYVQGFFEYMFIRRANAKLLCALKLHDALIGVIECPWPSMQGPRRVGKPHKRRVISSL